MTDKTDYTTLSDFEINKLVALSLGMRVAGLDDDHFYGDGYHDRYPDTVWAGNPEEAWEQICYTHTPDEIMPITIDNKISLQYEGCDGWIASTDRHTASGLRYYDCLNMNPYRAIAICYLKMMEASE